MIKPQGEDGVSFRGLFYPLTTLKAIHIIIFIGSIVYFNFLFNSFVWDDVSFIQNNPQVHTVNITQSFTKNKFNSEGYYRPIPALYFSTLYAVFQDQPFFYHVAQIAMHISVTCLLYLVFINFFSNELALLLALIFLVHPINVESVGYIGATQSELFSLFGFIALLINKNAKSIQSFLLIGVFLLLAMLTKEVGIIFLFLIVLWQIFYKKGRLLPIILVATSVLITYAILRFGIAGIYLERVTAYPIAKLSLLSRVPTLPAVIWYYLKTFLYPMDLAILQQWTVTKITISNFYFPVFIDTFFFILLLGLSFYFFLSKKKLRKSYYFFIFWFLSSLFFLMQIFPLDQTVADRWFYLPLMGLLGVIGVLVEAFRVNVKNIWILCFILGILFFLSTRTFIRSFDWRDSFTLTSHDIKISKDSWAMENNLSFDYWNQGRFEEAKTHAMRSITLQPNVENYTNLGGIYFSLGNYKQANITYLQALKLGDYNLAYESLAGLYLFYDDPSKHIDFIKNAALKKFPQDGAMWTDLAILEYTYGNKEDGKKSISNAYAYTQSPLTIFTYNAVMHNQPLHLEFKDGQVIY